MPATKRAATCVLLSCSLCFVGHFFSISGLAYSEMLPRPGSCSRAPSLGSSTFALASQTGLCNEHVETETVVTQGHREHGWQLATSAPCSSPAPKPRTATLPAAHLHPVPSSFRTWASFFFSAPGHRGAHFAREAFCLDTCFSPLSSFHFLSFSFIFKVFLLFYLTLCHCLLSTPSTPGEKTVEGAYKENGFFFFL